MHNLVCTCRNDVFLDQHFYAVRDWLEKTERAHAIRSIAVLHPRQNFPLQHRHEREKREKHGEQRDNVDQAGGDLDDPARSASNPGKQPPLRMDEDLIESRGHLREEKRLPLI